MNQLTGVDASGEDETMNHVKAAREAAEMSQRALAAKCRMSQQQIQRIECRQKPTLELACRISGALSKPLAELFPSETKKMFRDQ
jgi:transcriptional regulator with XRE-family HTH domain